MAVALEGPLCRQTPLSPSEWLNFQDKIRTLTAKIFCSEEWTSPTASKEELIRLFQAPDFRDQSIRELMNPPVDSVRVTLFSSAVLADLAEVKGRAALFEDKVSLGALRVMAAIQALRVVNNTATAMDPPEWEARFLDQTELRRGLGYIECALEDMSQARKEKFLQNPSRFCQFFLE